MCGKIEMHPTSDARACWIIFLSATPICAHLMLAIFLAVAMAFVKGARTRMAALASARLSIPTIMAANWDVKMSNFDAGSRGISVVHVGACQRDACGEVCLLFRSPGGHHCAQPLKPILHSFGSGWLFFMPVTAVVVRVVRCSGRVRAAG